MRDEPDFVLPEPIDAEIGALLERYPKPRSILLTVLRLVQEEFGQISVQAIEAISERLELPPSKVLETASFYDRVARIPAGKHKLRVCTGMCCSLLGGPRLLQHIEQRLAIKLGQSTPDRRFTLGSASCLANCDSAPVIECNGNYYENPTLDQLDRLIDQWAQQDNPREGER